MSASFADDQFAESASFAERIKGAQETVERERSRLLSESGIIEFINDGRGWEYLSEIKPGSVDDLSADEAPPYVAIKTRPHPMGGVSGFEIKGIPQSVASSTEDSLVWLSTAAAEMVDRVLNIDNGRRSPTMRVLSFEAFKHELNNGNFLNR